MISAKPVFDSGQKREAEFYLFLIVLRLTGTGENAEENVFSGVKMVFLGILEGNRSLCVMCCVPISGYLFAGAEDRSTWLRVSNRFFGLFSAILCHARG